MPAFYNLACDGLLPEGFAIVGVAMDGLTTEEFRARMSEDIHKFSTRKEFDQAKWDWLCSRLYYLPGKFEDDQAYAALSELTSKLDAQYNSGGNLLFYMATPPSVFGMISSHLEQAGFKKIGRAHV